MVNWWNRSVTLGQFIWFQRREEKAKSTPASSRRIKTGLVSGSCAVSNRYGMYPFFVRLYDKLSQLSFTVKCPLWLVFVSSVCGGKPHEMLTSRREAPDDDTTRPWITLWGQRHWQSTVSSRPRAQVLLHTKGEWTNVWLNGWRSIGGLRAATAMKTIPNNECRNFQ